MASRGRSRFRALLVWAGYTLAALPLLATAVVFAGSEWILRRHHEVATQPLRPTALAFDDAEGRRRAAIIGCLKGCHGPGGEGGTEEAPRIFSATAPTLTAVLPAYSDAELLRLVRFGVRRDGTSAVGMPAYTFYPMSDDELALIFRHLRQRPALPAVPRHRRVFPLGRLALVLGKWKVSADHVDPTAPRWGELPRTRPFERGRYTASVTCSECHGVDFKGLAYFPSPSLAIVMADVARAAFTEFTDQEIDDLYAFLTGTFADAGLPAGR